jgi:hypothetical protein
VSGTAACDAKSETNCVTCCQTNCPTGIADLVKIIQACACGSGGPCASKCANEYCVDGTVNTSGDACDTCIGNAVNPGGQCATPVTSGCSGDAPCNDYFNTCAGGCP